MNEFDLLAGQVFSTISDLMGENAVWYKSKSQQVKGKVLFKNPTESVQIGETEKYEHRPTEVTAEYYKGDFKGLMKTVSDKQKQQFITVKGRKYIVTEVTTKFDGKTHVAHLEPYKFQTE
jgi:uncharacterized membrane protein